MCLAKRVISIFSISFLLLGSLVGCSNKGKNISDEVVSAGTISIMSDGIFGIGDKSGGLHFYDFKSGKSVAIPNTEEYNYTNVQNAALYKDEVYLFEIKQNKIALVKMNKNGENVKTLSDNLSPILNEETPVSQMINDVYFTSDNCFLTMKTDTLQEGRLSSILKVDLKTNEVTNVEDPINEENIGSYTIVGADKDNIYYEKITRKNNILSLNEYMTNENAKELRDKYGDYFLYCLANMNMNLISKSITTNESNILVDLDNARMHAFNPETGYFYYSSGDSIYKINDKGNNTKLLDCEGIYTIDGEFEGSLYYTAKDKPGEIYLIRQLGDNIVCRINGRNVLFSIISKEDLISKNYNNAKDISW